eukprot:gene2630-1628_t
MCNSISIKLISPTPTLYAYQCPPHSAETLSHVSSNHQIPQHRAAVNQNSQSKTNNTLNRYAGSQINNKIKHTQFLTPEPPNLRHPPKNKIPLCSHLSKTTGNSLTYTAETHTKQIISNTKLFNTKYNNKLATTCNNTIKLKTLLHHHSNLMHNIILKHMQYQLNSTTTKRTSSKLTNVPCLKSNPNRNTHNYSHRTTSLYQQSQQHSGNHTNNKADPTEATIKTTATNVTSKAYCHSTSHQNSEHLSTLTTPSISHNMLTIDVKVKPILKYVNPTLHSKPTQQVYHSKTNVVLTNVIVASNLTNPPRNLKAQSRAAYTNFHTVHQLKFYPNTIKSNNFNACNLPTRNNATISDPHVQHTTKQTIHHASKKTIRNTTISPTRNASSKHHHRSTTTFIIATNNERNHFDNQCAIRSGNKPTHSAVVIKPTNKFTSKQTHRKLTIRALVPTDNFPHDKDKHTPSKTIKQQYASNLPNTIIKHTTRRPQTRTHASMMYFANTPKMAYSNSNTTLNPNSSIHKKPIEVHQNYISSNQTPIKPPTSYITQRTHIPGNNNIHKHMHLHSQIHTTQHQHSNRIFIRKPNTNAKTLGSNPNKNNLQHNETHKATHTTKKDHIHKSSSKRSTTPCNRTPTTPQIQTSNKQCCGENYATQFTTPQPNQQKTSSTSTNPRKFNQTLGLNLTHSQPIRAHDHTTRNSHCEMHLAANTPENRNSNTPHPPTQTTSFEIQATNPSQTHLTRKNTPTKSESNPETTKNHNNYSPNNHTPTRTYQPVSQTQSPYNANITIPNILSLGYIITTNTSNPQLVAVPLHTNQTKQLIIQNTNKRQASHPNYLASKLMQFRISITHGSNQLTNNRSNVGNIATPLLHTHHHNAKIPHPNTLTAGTTVNDSKTTDLVTICAHRKPNITPKPTGSSLHIQKHHRKTTKPIYQQYTGTHNSHIWHTKSPHIQQHKKCRKTRLTLTCKPAQPHNPKFKSYAQVRKHPPRQQTYEAYTRLHHQTQNTTPHPAHQMLTLHPTPTEIKSSMYMRYHHANPKLGIHTTPTSHHISPKIKPKQPTPSLPWLIQNPPPTSNPTKTHSNLGNQTALNTTTTKTHKLS